MRKREFTTYQLCISIMIPVILLFSVFYGNNVVTTMYESSPLPNRKTVIIDAGHGGEDGGAISCTGIYESRLNLEISVRLEAMLNLMGIRTVMIRREDISVHTQGTTIAQRKVSDLKHRVNIVNSQTDAILVSIHQNTFNDQRYQGAQVFYAGTSDSDRLAKQIQSDLVNNLNIGSNREAKKAAGIYLMDNIEITGVLVECGFLSNPEEETMLTDPVYQKKLCCVLATSLSRFLYSSSIA